MILSPLTQALLRGGFTCAAVASGLEAGRGDYVPLAVFALLYFALLLLTRSEETTHDH